MELKEQIREIRERNNRVEADKAWETSYFRIIFIAIITYIVAGLFLYIIGNHDFLMNALVPTIGYLLSAQSLPILKRWWIKRIYKKKHD